MDSGIDEKEYHKENIVANQLYIIQFISPHKTKN
jgi:hypothetical protein